MKAVSTNRTSQIKDITIEIGNIHILGNGAWGTALYSLVSKSSSDQKIFILAVPTNTLRKAMETIKNQVDSRTLIINGSKGIEYRTHKLPNEIVEEVLGKDIHYFSLIGPGFAQEVIDKNPTIVNLGYRNQKYLKSAKAIFQSTYFDVVPTKCIHAIEMMGAFKNIYAIGCGIAEGLGYGANTRTKIIIFAYQELKRLLAAMNYDYSQAAQIAFLGDLVLTCSSTESRNFTFGKLLVHNSTQKSLDRIGETIEGRYSVASVKFFEQKANIKLPLAKLIHDIINADDYKLTKKLFTDFILRP